MPGSSREPGRWHRARIAPAPARAHAPQTTPASPPQHPDLIEKQRRVFSDAIRKYADPAPADAAPGTDGGDGSNGGGSSGT